MKTMRLPLLCGAALLLGENSAAAQDAAPSSGPEDMAEVVVTAQKRSERLLDVPMSISAVAAEQLENSGITSTGDLQQAVPGLTTVNNGLGFVPVIRGVSSQGTSPGDESNVSIYLDDVYLGAPLAGLFDLADIERVEVLKGPQGTLFGRNATGGAIRIVTRKPSFTPQAEASVDYGFDFDEWKASAYFSGPLSESLAASLSGTYRKSDGYIDGIGPNEGRHYGDPDNYLVRAKLLFQPSQALQVTLSGDTQQTKNDTVATVWPPEGADPYPDMGNVPSQPFEYAGSTQPRQRVDGDSVALDATWSATPALTIRSITAYRDLDLVYQSDIDRTSSSLVALSLAQYQKNFSQEFNFSGDFDRWNWIAGLYYYDADAGNPHWTVLGGDSPGGSPFVNFESQVKTESYAGFGEIGFDATERLHFTAGARWTSEKKDYRYRTLLTSDIDKRDDETWTEPTFRGVARYDLADDANVYASISNGFKSGVYDAYSSLGVPVDPEKVVASEIGAKARIHRITLTAAAYNYDYKDIQVSSFATINGVVVLSLTNAASATMRGVEITADGPITERLSFSIGGNWAPTADFDRFESAQVTVPLAEPTPPIVAQVIAPYDASGSRIPRTPEWTINGRLTYTAPLFGGMFSGNVSGFHSPGF